MGNQGIKLSPREDRSSRSIYLIILPVIASWEQSNANSCNKQGKYDRHTLTHRQTDSQSFYFGCTIPVNNGYIYHNLFVQPCRMNLRGSSTIT